MAYLFYKKVILCYNRAINLLLFFGGGNFMYYSYEDEVQVVFQIRIQELKLKIRGLLNKYFTRLGYYGILTEEDFMVYNKVIGK